jgi:hypothetical protein
MSAWKFKNVQKAQDVVILYFTDTSGALWADTRSVTIPIDDAQRLLTKLQATLHPGSHP